MHSYVVVVAKPGRSVPPEVASVLARRAPAEVPFDPKQHLEWSDASGRVRYAGWQVAADALGIGSHWSESAEGLTAFSGHVWRCGAPWHGRSSWATQLEEVLRTTSPVHDPGAFRGVFSVVSVGRDGTGIVCPDPLGLGLVYVAEDADVVAVSSRAALAAAVLARGGTPVRDLDALGWLVHTGHLLGDGTGFDGVSVLPPGSHVEVDARAGARTITTRRLPWIPDAGVRDLDADGLRALLPPITADIVDALQTYAALEVPGRIFELTGGKDSRLVLAHLLQAGVADRFRFVTWGAPDLPDCQVAAELAARYGLEHHVPDRDGHKGFGIAVNASSGPDETPPTPGPAAAAAAAPPSTPTRPPAGRPTFDDRLRNHVWLTSGALSTWDLRSTTAFSPTVSVTGLCGEGLRTNYPRTSSLASMDELAEFVREGGFLSDAGGLLRPEARRHYDESLISILESLRPEGGTAQDAIDGFYLSGRLRRWFGTFQEVDRRNRVFPLLSMPGLRAAFAIGSRNRRGEVLVRELMRAAAPELVDAPFAGGKGWPAASPAGTGRIRPGRGHRPGRSAGRGAAVPTAARQSQTRDLDRKLPALRAHLDLPADHRLFDLVDRRALQQALDDFGSLPFQAQRGVHGVVTAAIWASGSERAATAGVPAPTRS